MDKNQVKSAIDSIELNDEKKNDIFNKILKDTQDEKIMSQRAIKNVKRIMDRYVVYGAVAVLCVCMFSIYSVRADIFSVSSDGTEVVDDVAGIELRTVLEEGYFNALTIEDGKYVDNYMEIPSDDVFAIWNSLVENEYYSKDISLVSISYSDTSIDMVFSHELFQVENSDELIDCIRQSFLLYFVDYDEINIMQEE